MVSRQRSGQAAGKRVVVIQAEVRAGKIAVGIQAEIRAGGRQDRSWYPGKG